MKSEFAQMNNSLVVEHLTKDYPGVRALDDINVEFREGEVHALCGENGAGKSTLIKMISGAATPDKGTISYGGITYTSMKPELSRSLGIEAVYQEIILGNTLSVAENIFMGTKVNNKAIVDFAEMNKRTQVVLDELHVRTFKPTDLVNDLKTANRQLVVIAKAIAMKAKFIILDEPTGPLGETEVETLLKIVVELKSKGIGILYVSHRLDEVFRISDRITVFRNGQLICTKHTKDMDMHELITAMVGRELSETFPERDAKPGEVVLEVKNLCANGVNDESFQLRKGEILGIGGLVGSGRTELVSTIFGARKLKGGEIWIKGKKVNIRTPKEALAHGIAFAPEDRKLHGLMIEQGVDTNITITILKKISRNGFVNTKLEVEKRNEIIEKLKIKVPVVTAPAKKLSGGNQQKVVLAKWLLADVDIMIFDEPTRGIDVGAKREIYFLMNELIEKGISIIMVSSEMDELLGMSDRIVVLHENKISGELEKKDFSQVNVLRFASGMSLNQESEN